MHAYLYMQTGMLHVFLPVNANYNWEQLMPIPHTLELLKFFLYIWKSEELLLNDLENQLSLVYNFCYSWVI